MPLTRKIALIEEEIYYRSIMPEFEAEENEYGHIILPDDHKEQLSNQEYRKSYNDWAVKKEKSFGKDDRKKKENYYAGQRALDSKDPKTYENWENQNKLLPKEAGKIENKNDVATKTQSVFRSHNTRSTQEKIKNTAKTQLDNDIKKAEEKLREAEEKRKEEIRQARNNLETKKKEAEAKQIELEELKKQLGESQNKLDSLRGQATSAAAQEAQEKANQAAAAAKEAKLAAEAAQARDAAKKTTETSGIDPTSSNTNIEALKNTVKLLEAQRKAEEESKIANDALKKAKLESAKAHTESETAVLTFYELKEKITDKRNEAVEANKASTDAQKGAETWAGQDATKIQSVFRGFTARTAAKKEAESAQMAKADEEAKEEAKTALEKASQTKEEANQREKEYTDAKAKLDALEQQLNTASIRLSLLSSAVADKTKPVKSNNTKETQKALRDAKKWQSKEAVTPPTTNNQNTDNHTGEQPKHVEYNTRTQGSKIPVDKNTGFVDQNAYQQKIDNEEIQPIKAKSSGPSNKSENITKYKYEIENQEVLKIRENLKFKDPTYEFVPTNKFEGSIVIEVLPITKNTRDGKDDYVRTPDKATSSIDFDYKDGKLVGSSLDILDTSKVKYQLEAAEGKGLFAKEKYNKIFVPYANVGTNENPYYVRLPFESTVFEKMKKELATARQKEVAKETTRPVNEENVSYEKGFIPGRMRKIKNATLKTSEIDNTITSASINTKTGNTADTINQNWTLVRRMRQLLTKGGTHEKNPQSFSNRSGALIKTRKRLNTEYKGDRE